MVAKIFGTCLVTTGSFLEVYYYVSHFQSDGSALWLAIIKGLALNLLLQLTIYLGIRKKQWLILSSVLFTYSVFCTSAGQAVALKAMTKSADIEIAQANALQSEIDRYTDQRATLDSEYKLIVIPQSIEERALYRTTVAQAEARKREIMADIKAIDEKLDALRGQVTVSSAESIKVRTSYTFWQELTGFAENIIQFLFQLILSILVAIMAPTGVIVFTTEKLKEKIKVKAEMPKTESIKPKESFINTRYIGGMK